MIRHYVRVSLFVVIVTWGILMALWLISPPPMDVIDPDVPRWGQPK